MSAQAQPAYSFESANSKPPRRENADDRKALSTRLELAPAQETALEKQLNDFVTHHHGNIEWYTKAINRELWLRRIYFAVSMGLLVVVPVAIFALTTDGLFGESVTPHITAALTAGLSGLFAFHRGATAWLDKRQLVALYAKTNAQLKSAVYGFEQTWKSSRRGARTIAELSMALEDATAAALAIVSAEQDAHYEIEAAPTFGLSDMLGSATSAAGQLTTALAAKESEEDKDRRELERSIRELSARSSRLTEMISRIEAEIDVAADDAPKAKVDELNSLIEKRQSTELEQAIAVSKLKSLRRV